MNITTIVRAATVITVGCNVALVGIAAYSVKQQSVLNRTIADGMQQIANDKAKIAQFTKANQK